MDKKNLYYNYIGNIVFICSFICSRKQAYIRANFQKFLFPNRLFSARSHLVRFNVATQVKSTN